MVLISEDNFLHTFHTHHVCNILSFMPRMTIILMMISIIVAIPANKNENSHHWWWSSPSYRPFCLGSVPDRALAEKEPQRANKTGPTTCHHQHLPFLVSVFLATNDGGSQFFFSSWSPLAFLVWKHFQKSNLALGKGSKTPVTETFH